MAPSIKARPTVYNGIQMRSRLEADYAAYLDGQNRQWEYEPECFASAEGQWLPDFRVKNKIAGNPSELIELKPAGLLHEQWLSGEVDKILTQMTIAWASDPQVSLALVYWKHGGPAELIIMSTGRHSPWLAGKGPIPLLWTGMGQYDWCDRQVSGG